MLDAFLIRSGYVSFPKSEVCCRYLQMKPDVVALRMKVRVEG